MESITLAIILLLVIVLVYIFFFRKSKEAREKKSYYLKRFLRNKEQSLKHIHQVEALAIENNCWDKKAFTDKDVTFRDYLELLKNKYDKDYSEISYQVLKRNKLTQSQKQEYTKKLIEQSEDLYLMEVDLATLNKNSRTTVTS